MSIFLLSATSATDPLVVAIVAAALAGFVAVGTKAVDMTAARRTRRMAVYSEALRAAVAWQESLYRVRRRPNDGTGDAALVERFHDLQEQLAYHLAWLQLEDEGLADEYRALVDAVKKQTQDPIRAAWTDRNRPRGADPIPADQFQPDTEIEQAAFLQACRIRLSVVRRVRAFAASKTKQKHTEPTSADSQRSDEASSSRHSEEQ